MNNNVFANKNYLLVFMGALVSELGAILYNFAVSFYILEISSNNALLQGMYLGMCGVAMLLFTPIGGVLADRFNKAKIMYISDYLKGGLIILAAMLLMFMEAKEQIVILFILGILSNAISGIFIPASGSLLVHIVDTNQLQQANAYFAMKTSLENILGIIMAGILYVLWPIYTLFILVGLAFLTSGISEMFIRYEYIPSKENLTLQDVFQDMQDGIRYLKTKRTIISLLCAILFMNFFLTPLTGNFIPYFIKTDLAGASYLLDTILTPELWASVFNICFGISSFLGAAFMGTKDSEEQYGNKITVGLIRIGVMLLVLTISYWIMVDRQRSLNGFLILLCLTGFLIGLIISTINIRITTGLMRIVDKDKLGKVNSIVNMGSQGMIPIASVLAGMILQGLSSTALLLICSLGFMMTALLLYKRI